MIYKITENNFDDIVAKSDIPCVIEFGAGWCTMCDAMAPTLDSLSEKYEGRVKFCRVDIDSQKKLRIKFAVASVPYIVFVHNGIKAPLFDEIVTKERLQERIDFVLSGADIPTARPL